MSGSSPSGGSSAGGSSAGGSSKGQHDDDAAAAGAPDAAATPPPGGPDAAKLALRRAQRAARDKGLTPGTLPPKRRGAIPGTGPGFPQHRARDPQLVSDTLSKLVADQGWTAPVSVGAVVGRWRDVVGDEIADHAEPETFTEGKLVVRTTSTAWATQLRMLLPQLQRRLDEEIGEGIVEEIVVIGPGAPSWVRGLRVVKGRGPRDTYG